MSTPTPNPAIASSPVKALTDAVMGQMQAANWTGSAGTALIANMPGASPARLAIHNGIVDDTGPPVYNCVTYRVSNVTPLKAFEGPFAEVPTSPVEDLRVDFEAWCQPNACDVSEILAVVSATFRNLSFQLTGGAATAGANAWMFRASLLTSQPDLYDRTLKAHFGLMSFLFRVQR